MDADEDRAISRLRSCLQLILCSRSPVSDAFTWCQDAFPGSSYLSCAVPAGADSFATTCNLLERNTFQVDLVPGQDAPLHLPTEGLLLHRSWPQRHPNLQVLWRSNQWESVMAVIVPSTDESTLVVAASAQAAQSPACLSESSSESLGRSNPDDSEALPNGHNMGDSCDQDAQLPAACSGAVLVLGLRQGQHDLERTLVRLQALAGQLAPVVRDQRQPLLDQALHSANTADATAASARVNGHELAAAAEPAGPTADAAAATADSAAATAAAPVPRPAPTPFAATDALAIPGIVSPLSFYSGGEALRPGRRQEQSGSLPLDQMLSRNPSPIGSMPSQNSLQSMQSLDRQKSDSMPSRQSSTQVSRLGSANPPRDDPASHGSYGSLLDAAAAAAASSAGFDSGILPPPARPLATVYSGQGLPPDSRKWSYDQEHSMHSLSDQESAPRFGELAEGSAGGSFEFENGAKEADDVAKAAAVRSAVRPDDSARASFESSWSRGASAEAGSQTEGNTPDRHRQHPWLMYFYDNDLEQDYSKYHAKQMAKVDTVSLFICVVIYLHLGFSNSHGFAYHVPITFGVTLGIMLSIVYVVLYMQDRWVAIREPVERLGAFGYLASAAFFSTPAVLNSASTAQLRQIMFLARYSNTSTLFTSCIGLMVRFHIHMPCQLINFAMSAAVLPSTICQAGFTQYTPWKCITAGIAAQFLIGVVLSSTVVALNERRLRKMYLRAFSQEGATSIKAKTV